MFSQQCGVSQPSSHITFESHRQGISDLSHCFKDYTSALQLDPFALEMEKASGGDKDKKYQYTEIGPDLIKNGDNCSSFKENCPGSPPQDMRLFKMVLTITFNSLEQ